jgi:ribosomal protein S4
MKATSKYKIYYISKKIIDQFPKRILNFKRSKWRIFRKRYKTLFLRRKRRHFSNYKFRIILKYQKKIRSKKIYKNSLLAKTQINQMFGHSLNKKNVKKQLYKSNMFISGLNSLLIKYLFRLDVLLWKVHIFSTIDEVKNFIKRGFILVNNQIVEPTYMLKTGDVIFLNYKKMSLSIKQILRKFRFIPKIYSFIELNLYIGLIVILYNFENINFKEFSLFLDKPFNYSNYNHYLLKN